MALTAHILGFENDSSTRLNDYLNDKLQTFADFETLDSLLANIRSQQKVLRKQLEDAQDELRTVDEDREKQDTAVRRQIQVYKQEAADIDRRLRIVTQSDTSDDAVQRFDASMEKLNRLDIANGYLSTLANVERLSAESISALKSKPDEALSSYSLLNHVLVRLKSLQEDAEGAAPHLVDHVEQLTHSLRQTIKESLDAELRALLDKILWPRSDTNMPNSLKEQWDVACRRLLTLQKPELTTQASGKPTYSHNQLPSVLLPLEVLVKPLEMRFRFHFNGDKPTNRVDKPEYFLSHALDILDTYAPFIEENFQSILVNFTRGSDLAFHAACIDARSAFIVAILPMVRSKVFTLVPQLLSQPNLLSHLIRELLRFDSTLREDWRFIGDGPSSGGLWKGMTWEILNHSDWFERWLQVEKDFALARYDSIVNDPESSTLDFDSVDENATKPTRAAIRVKDLLETVTSRYRPLVSFSHKLRFLIDVQVSIFDRFHARLNSGLEAFVALTSSISRTMTGASSDDLASVQGVKGLDRLCRIFGSAEYLERAMNDWSDDIFFLDLWNELQSRAQASSQLLSNGETQANNDVLVAGPLSIAEVASRTSGKLTESTGDDALGSESITGALFEETASAYLRLRNRSEKVLVDKLTSGLRESLRSYARNNPWSSLSIPSTVSLTSSAVEGDEPNTPSIDLNQALDYLSSHLGFLAKAIAPAPLRRISRQLLRSLDSHIFDRVIMANTFSAHGARQLEVDIDALVSVADRTVTHGLGSKGLQRSLEAKAILLLDSTDPNPPSAKEQQGAPISNEVNQTSVAAFEHRLFESNLSARLLLEELGMDLLTETEAREIFKRRVNFQT